MVLLLTATNSFASQHDTELPTASPYPGLTMLGDINDAFDTFQTNFSGATAPGSPKTYQLWYDTSTDLLKIYDGTDWFPIGKITSDGWEPISNNVPSVFPSSGGSSNAYTVSYSPTVTDLIVGQVYPLIASFQNTSSATLNIDSIGAYPLTKQGAVALSSGDITDGMALLTVWDGTEFQIIGQMGNTSVGTVTNVSTGTGLTGGPVTSSGTISLATISNNTGLVNVSGGTAAPTATSLSSWIDNAIGSTQGSILTRSSTGWTYLAPGTSGQLLTSQGSSANLTWGSSLFSKEYTSPWASCTAGSTLTYAHGLGAAPRIAQVEIKMTSAASGYSIGDIINMSAIPQPQSSTAGSNGAVYYDATNVYLLCGSLGSFYFLNKSTGAFASAYFSSFSVRVKTYY